MLQQWVFHFRKRQFLVIDRQRKLELLASKTRSLWLLTLLPMSQASTALWSILLSQLNQQWSLVVRIQLRHSLKLSRSHQLRRQPCKSTQTWMRKCLAPRSWKEKLTRQVPARAMHPRVNNQRPKTTLEELPPWRPTMSSR